MRGKTFIKLLIEIKDNQLDFTLTNSKPKEPDNSINKRGIGLTNVQKRLQLLYPNNHTLQIESTDETYKVFLLVALQEKIIISANTDPHPELKPQPVSYA